MCIGVTGRRTFDQFRSLGIIAHGRGFPWPYRFCSPGQINDGRKPRRIVLGLRILKTLGVYGEYSLNDTPTRLFITGLGLSWVAVSAPRPEDRAPLLELLRAG